ncbi:MFS family permease [Caldalkalibacillus uzonensis]|uniref:MFS family permease n=1 Tax=Caldalkalibacillus uzonensis TaxID=353224 RepID=A0ABU0CWW7_9BACI|nr:hypothetical protein [Caldalkalibacillus uzonensis]MDQ0340829.1 MFS family permease [Caldalkalibacillus uzonensis]
MLSDRFSERITVLQIIGFSSSVLLLFFSLASIVKIPAYLIIVISILLGFTISGWNGVYQASIIEIGGEKMAAVSSSISFTFTYTGIFIFPLFFGWLNDLISNYFVSWIVLSFTMFFSVFFMIHRHRNVT